MNIQLIIFDFDGTLGDTRRNIVKTMQETMKELSLPVADEITCASTIGLKLKDGFKVIYPFLSDNEAENCLLVYRRIFNANKKLLVPEPFPSTLETLAELEKRGFILAVASSRTSSSLFEFLDEMGFATFISFVLGIDEVINSKPHPEAVFRALEKFNVKTENTLVVGDMSFDILMGKNAGVHTCGVSYGNGTVAQLKESGAEHIIDSMPELLKIVKISR